MKNGGKNKCCVYNFVFILMGKTCKYQKLLLITELVFFYDNNTGKFYWVFVEGTSVMLLVCLQSDIIPAPLYREETAIILMHRFVLNRSLWKGQINLVNLDVLNLYIFIYWGTP